MAQRIALLLSFDKFRLVSQGLKHMEADFGKAFLVEHYEKPEYVTIPVLFVLITTTFLKALLTGEVCALQFS